MDAARLPNGLETHEYPKDDPRSAGFRTHPSHCGVCGGMKWMPGDVPLPPSLSACCCESMARRIDQARDLRGSWFGLRGPGDSPRTNTEIDGSTVRRLQVQIQALQAEVRESRARIGEPQVFTHPHGNGCSVKACGCRLLAARERVDALGALERGE